MQFAEIFDNCSAVATYSDAVQRVYGRETKEYDEIMTAWGELIGGGMDMPAYGVSLDSLTRKEMKCGKWVEFVFEGCCSYNGMPYEKLLVKTGREFYGFNIIRFNSSEGYSGRCFYYQLNDKTMQNFVEIIENY